jgi:hypothetical protein
MHEGLLRRLSGSEYRGSFALKGGLLVQSLSHSGGRATRDIDFPGSGIPNETQTLRTVFLSILGISADDALRFDQISLKVEAMLSSIVE